MTASLSVYAEHPLALAAAALLERMTGDRCRVVAMGLLYRVLRFDPTGREVRQ